MEKWKEGPLTRSIGMFLLLFLVAAGWDSCTATAKAGIPGIKIKPVSSLEDTTEYPELHAVIGSSVSLPCPLTPPSADDVISLVLWYRLDLPNPIYTLDARSAPGADSAKHFSGKALGSRAYFNVSHRGTAHLRLSPVEEDDSGEYRCRVDFKRGRTLSRLVKLNVIVPVKKVSIRGRDNVTYSGLIGPFTEGMSLLLICEARGGFPTPVVTWRQGARILPGSATMDEHGVVRNELTFARLGRKDLLQVFTCQASNNNMSGPIYASVSIDMNLRPQSVRITTAPALLEAGQRFEVSCQAEGSRPPARLSWIRGQERVDHLAIQTTFDRITVSTLSMVVGWEDNGRRLACEATNPKMPDEGPLVDGRTLNVLYPPQLSLVFGASEQHEHIREGSDVYFECNIQASPPVSEVLWRFQWRPLLHDPGRGVVVRNHSLLLHDVGRRNRGTYQCTATNPQGKGSSEEVVLRIQFGHDPGRGVVVRNHSLLLHNVGRRNRGTYQCTATNPQGKGSSEEVVLRIQYSPVCGDPQRRTYGVARNEEVDVSCSVDADPPDVVFRWSLNGSAFESRDVVSFDRSGGTARSVAKFSPRSRSDYGALYCYAKNDVGSMREPCVFNMVPSGPPEPLQNCSVTNQSFESLSLSCDALAHSDTEASPSGRHSSSYHLELWGVRREQLLANVTSQSHPRFVVKGLPPGTPFVAVLYAGNEQGRSASVVMTAATLFSAERQTEEEEEAAGRRGVLSGVLLVSLAALGTLALLAVAAVAAVFKNKTRTRASEVATTGQEMVEKNPKPSKPTFEDGNPYVYHTREVTTEYVHLTPNKSECIYESLHMEGGGGGGKHPSSYETVLCRAHVLNEEGGLEVIIPVIER